MQDPTSYIEIRETGQEAMADEKQEKRNCVIPVILFQKTSLL
jgi:hypothetical protein